MRIPPAIRALFPIFGLTLSAPAIGRPAPAPRPPAIAASSAILVDAESGQVLYERNADLRRPPASTTKILTTILLIEKVGPDEMIEADKTASETDGSSLYMLPGEKIAAREIVYALMLRSANDACVATARHIGGSQAAFADMMNRKAGEIGATDSHFSNPNGLHSKDHYTTARDLAKIACYAARLPRFNEATRTRSRTIVRDPRNKDTFLKNRAKFLWTYPGADGIKTGYTVPAGRCFVGSATRGRWRLISVVLNSPDMFGETARLMDYGFGAFEPRVLLPERAFGTEAPIRGGAQATVRAVSASAVRVVLPRGDIQEPRVTTRLVPALAPVAAGQTLGHVVLHLPNGTTLTAPLVATRAVARAALPVRQGPAWPRYLATVLSLAVFWYGSAHTKGPRVRRHRFQARL
jgi:D-alanyl-D-alanine carboxypeptidase (penicillin-binding protein 5/6)